MISRRGQPRGSDGLTWRSMSTQLYPAAHLTQGDPQPLLWGQRPSLSGACLVSGAARLETGEGVVTL